MKMKPSWLVSALVFACLVASNAAWANESRATFRPGQIWNDTSGRPINAHAGGILYYAGVYYWYGEFKEGRTYLPLVNKSWGGTRVIAGGVSCYSSTNLYDWKNEGLALPSVAEDPDNDLACEKVIERPKVIYNATTKKFVMWLHQDSPDYSAAQAGVAVSDAPTGPFKYLGGFRPNAGVWPVNVTDGDRQPNATNVLARDFSGGQMAREMAGHAAERARQDVGEHQVIGRRPGDRRRGPAIGADEPDAA